MPSNDFLSFSFSSTLMFSNPSDLSLFHYFDSFFIPEFYIFSSIGSILFVWPSVLNVQSRLFTLCRHFCTRYYLFPPQSPSLNYSNFNFNSLIRVFKLSPSSPMFVRISNSFLYSFSLVFSCALFSRP